ncbi:Leucine-rich repeat (LRR) family protein [Dorcoceras hygrometricum]|uniref:Leucine-rich repeat (LRR) family protein n=1 Tax=Dorcoceras hygrometricum TaxID=472368 RepID=A0A2Z7BWS9_9LAMI|nr:Leucine-rich repeat (LRR) family protein [Dorcoceras hygrometricum]
MANLCHHASSKHRLTIIIFFIVITLAAPGGSRSSADVAALRAFKSAIEPTSIPPNSCIATWNFSTDPCTTPRTNYFTCGVTCSGGRIIQLTLDSQGYAGKLTPLISYLTQLITLDLADNSFYGPIPASISSLSNLESLILRLNSFSGPIPPSIAALKSLKYLDLSRNSLSGSMPSMNSLAGLTRLDLSFNRFTGSLHKLPPNVKELAMKANHLSGSLIKYPFKGLTRLMTLELSENSFDGTLDSWVFSIPSLQQINLSNNSFTGIVISKPSDSELVAVDLSFNKIEGFLPTNLADFPMLRSLVLSYNRFRGPIPWQYSKKGSSLQRIYLDGNFFNGSPPAEFFSRDSPISGSLGDNCLRNCPNSSQLCLKLQKPASICRQAYGGKPRS